MSDKETSFQTYICPNCFDDHEVDNYARCINNLMADKNFKQQKIDQMQKMIDCEREEVHRLIKSLSDIVKASFLESEESYSIARHALTAFNRDKIKQLEDELSSLNPINN